MTEQPTITAVQTGDPAWPITYTVAPGWAVCELCGGSGMIEEPGCKADPATGWRAEDPYIEQCECRGGYVRTSHPLAEVAA